MKSSVRSLFSLAVVLAAAMFDVLSWAWRGISHVMRAVLIGPTVVAVMSKSTVAMQRASQFVLRIIKRDRPTVMSQWRMCPSV